MAITYHATNFFSRPNGEDVIVDLSPYSLVENDLILLMGGHSRTSANAGAVTSGYTELFDTTTNGIRFSVSYKVAGVSPDTSVTGAGSGNTDDAAAYAVYVFRGVDTSTPIDATATTASGTSAAPNSPSITTITDGAVVVSAFLTGANLVSATAPTGYDAQAFSWGQSETNPVSVGAGFKTISSAGAENPGAWSVDTSAAWQAASIALRPLLNTVDGALSGGSAGATASFVGYQDPAGLFSATGTADVLFGGNSLVSSPASMTGSAAVDFVGNSFSNQPQPFSMTGTGTALFVGSLAGGGALSATGRAVPDFSGSSINNVRAALAGLIGVQWVGATSKMESVREDIRSRGAATVNM